MNRYTSRPLDAVAALIMLGLTLSWGLNQVSVKLALPEIPPFIQATVRSIGAFAVIVALGALRGVPLTARDGTLAAGLIAGVLFGLEFLLIFPALQFTAASRATLFIYTAPFFVAIGSSVLLGEKLRAAQWLGLLLRLRPRRGVRRAGCLARRQAVARRHHDGRRGRRLGRDHAGHQGERAAPAPAEKVLAYQLVVSIPMLALGMLSWASAWPPCRARGRSAGSPTRPSGW